ncbi:MAG TPA: hypothetical protein VME69_08275, partial [Methylocella sp.]|nr:hypothetical protein [Methylocella sp.]
HCRTPPGSPGGKNRPLIGSTNEPGEEEADGKKYFRKILERSGFTDEERVAAASSFVEDDQIV